MILPEAFFKSIVYSVCLYLDTVILVGLLSTTQAFSISYIFPGVLVPTLQPVTCLQSNAKNLPSQLITHLLLCTSFQIQLQPSLPTSITRSTLSHHYLLHQMPFCSSDMFNLLVFTQVLYLLSFLSIMV